MSDLAEKDLSGKTGAPGRARATWKQLLERHAKTIEGGKSMGVITITSMDRWETWKKIDGADVWQLEAGGLLNDRH